MTRLRIFGIAAVLAITASTLGSVSSSAETAVAPHASSSFAGAIGAKFAGRATFSSSIEDHFQKVSPVQPLSAPLCRGTMDNAHVSSGGHAVVAKARFVCDGDAPGTDIDAILVLWVCALPLPAGYSYNTPTAQYGCTEKGSAHYTFTMSAGEQQTRYVPPASGETAGGARGSGYWPACMGYKRNGGTINYVCSNGAPKLTA